MSSQSGRPDPAKRPLEEAMRARAQRRRERVRADLRRHRQGDHRIPTWVLAAVAGVILAAFFYVIITT
jgi:type VI protein secretion system component VasF